MRIRIEVDLGQVAAMFSGMVKNADLEGKLGESIHEILMADALRQFQAGGIDPSWAPLARSTVKEKDRMGYPRLNRMGMISPSMVQGGAFGPKNILERTGALLSSWTQEGDPNHFVKITADSVESGSTLKYADYHQNPKPGSKLPKRAIGITDQAKAQIAELITKHIGGTS